MAIKRDPIKSLMDCPKCNSEMRLVGVERQTTARDLYTFECPKCGALEVRGVKVE